MVRIYWIALCLIFGATLFAQEPLDSKISTESGKPRLAILNFEVRGSGLDATLGDSVADLVATKLVTPDYQIIERLQIKKVIRERQLQAGDIIDAEQAQKLQKDLGAEYVMIGCIEKYEDQMQGNYRVVKVENLEVQTELKDCILNAANYQDFVQKLCRSLERQAGHYQDVCGIARQLTDKIAGYLCTNPPSTSKYTIAVFPFGDSEEKATSEMGILPLLLQSELSNFLRPKLAQHAKGKYIILDKDQLADRFESISPEGINPQKIDRPGLIKRLEKAKIQVAVIGHYNTKELSATSQEITVEAFLVVAPTQKTTKYDVKISPTELVNYSGLHQQKLSGRLDVEFWITKENKTFDNPAEQLKWDSIPTNWEKLPVYECSNPKSKWVNVRFLKLTRDMEGRRYKIRLINRGKPEIEKGHPKDPDRLFAAALAIDGVNSFYQKRVDGSLGPVIMHPQKAQKWVLTAPGRVLESSPDSFMEDVSGSQDKRIIEHGLLKTVPGLGHSQADVRGFQKGKLHADAFIFKKPEESVAECLGITTDIGLITVHFYTERLPFVPRAEAKGTGAGPEIPSRVHQTYFPMQPEPCEVIRIVYRYSDELPDEITAGDLTLCNP